MHHPMPCHEFKMDKPLRGPAFGKYAGDMRPTFSPLSRLKGRIGLRLRVMRHILLPIWKEIIHFPRRVDPFPP